MGWVHVWPPSKEKYTPVTPTPFVKGHVLGSPALHASRSISSFDPATTTDGLCASMPTVGSFCLFWAKGEGGLPTDTSVSPWADAGTAGSASVAVTAATPSRTRTRFTTMPSLLAGKRTLGGHLTGLRRKVVKRRKADSD